MGLYIKNSEKIFRNYERQNEYIESKLIFFGGGGDVQVFEETLKYPPFKKDTLAKHRIVHKTLPLTPFASMRIKVNLKRSENAVHVTSMTE